MAQKLLTSKELLQLLLQCIKSDGPNQRLVEIYSEGNEFNFSDVVVDGILDLDRLATKINQLLSL